MQKIGLFFQKNRVAFLLRISILISRIEFSKISIGTRGGGLIKKSKGMLSTYSFTIKQIDRGIVLVPVNG